MRARNIKPGFFTNELLGTYDPIISLLFAGLWCLADRDGILQDRPMRIKAELFPYREGLDINGYLTVMERDGFLTRYTVDGVGYIQIENFARHQSPHHTEKAKGYPDKTKQNKATQGKGVLTPLSNGECKVPERSDLFIPDSLIPDSKESPSDSSAKADRIPYQAIADTYNDVCGDMFPRVAKLTDQRKRAIAKAWRLDMDNEDDSLRTDSVDYWRRYFTACTRRGFFQRAASGEAKGEHAGWRPDFDFLIKQTTWLGMREGKYQ